VTNLYYIFTNKKAHSIFELKEMKVNTNRIKRLNFPFYNSEGKENLILASQFQGKK
jgi:hypothetical protein